MEGKGALTYFLACVSDCCYHFELDNDFPDNEMRMAYLTMKKAWEDGDNTKPFMATMARNNKAMSWAIIMTIWLFVLDSNTTFWNDMDKDLPLVGRTDKERELWKKNTLEIIRALRKVRSDWKEFHDAKRITDIEITFMNEGYDVKLYGLDK